jgi:hypothetical protein
MPINPDLKAARGVYIGLGLGALTWALAGLLVWWLW